MPFSHPAQTPAAPVRLPVHLPGHFATLDAPCGGGKRKMRSSFPGSLSRASFRAASHGQVSGQLLTGTFDSKIPVLTGRCLSWFFQITIYCENLSCQLFLLFGDQPSWIL
jgi:hypothetical protein